MVYGRTMAYDYAYTPPVLRPVHCPSSTAYTVSSRFVCIPTSFSISTSAVGVPQAEALSYINNIDPSATSLYERIETVVSRFVPLFEHVLTDLHRNNPLRQRISGAYSYTDCHGEPDTPEHSDDEDERLTYERELRDWAFNRPINLPDVMQEGYTGDLEKRHFTVSLMETTIKVIVRVTEIRIQPGGPDYAGTPWHVEGMRNEHIVACAMYCTEMINLIPASIEFRMSVTAPHHFIPGDTGATIRTWGLDHLSPCNQHLGSVPMSPGLGVAFPNIYQHRLTSTCLENPHSEGSMTILGLYLMDPDLADGSSGSGWDLTPSTESVPPQQKEWIKRAVEESIDIRLPVEIVEQIINNVEGVMSEQEAEAFAREMREERELFWQAHDTYRFCLPFDVWAT
ncbi:hypothetical protein AcW1_000997 [Taiwanofungus camphoratus]|nr:hypothetical protein AcW1_000997 [Antrodia cinnamomea]KAI0964097.1 hypothetical protein AcW1_000997 [Antrodia cinnamomea]